MIYVCECINYRSARYYCDEFLHSLDFDDNEDVKVAIHNCVPVVTIGEDEIYFIPCAVFNTWCKGRTYMFLNDPDKVVYHNGGRVS